MGLVHDIIEDKGKLAAVAAELDRREVEAAAAYMADEDSGIGFLYSGWCQAALPHRRLPDDEGWQIDGERATLVVAPGMRPSTSGKPVMVGVPYGSRARLIMIYLQSEALRTGSRDVELGRSLRGWLTRLGIPQGGKSIKAVRDQAERISRCRLSFHYREISRLAPFSNENLVDRAIFLDAESSDQGSLFVETARLSERFFNELQRHPVPLEEAAIRAINNNSMALDIYAWLAYRLHVLSAPLPISWKALKGQFGKGFIRPDNFKATFTDNLRLAAAVYRAARVEADDRGLTLYPSKPPVAHRQTARPAKVPARQAWNPAQIAEGV